MTYFSRHDREKTVKKNPDHSWFNFNEDKGTLDLIIQSGFDEYFHVVTEDVGEESCSHKMLTKEEIISKFGVLEGLDE